MRNGTRHLTPNDPCVPATSHSDMPIIAAEDPLHPGSHILFRITATHTRRRLRLLETRTVLIHTWHIDTWTVHTTDPNIIPLLKEVATIEPSTTHFTYTGEHINAGILLKAALDGSPDRLPLL